MKNHKKKCRKNADLFFESRMGKCILFYENHDEGEAERRLMQKTAASHTQLGTVFRKSI